MHTSRFARTRSWVLALAVTFTVSATVPALYAQTPPAPPAAPGGVVERGINVALQGLPIQRVEVLGNTRTETKLILDQVRAQAGQAYDRRQVDVDVRAIAALDLFLTVRAEVIPTPDNKVVVRYLVEERPTVTAVEITGNRRLKDEDIRDMLLTRVGQGIDQFSINTDVKAIEDQYRKDGYGQVSVEVDQDALKTGVVRYKITEGPRSRIRKVNFEGNTAIKTDALKWKISTKRYFWFFQKGLVNEDTLAADLQVIREQYQKKGYLDARANYVLDYSADKNDVTVRFIVNEGPRYKIRNLNITGNEVFSTGELLDEFSLRSGDWAQRDRVELMQKKLEDKYGANGYIYRVVETRSAYTDEPGVVDLNVTITEGKPYTVGRVIVRGNPNIQDRVIRRQVRIYPDQTYDLTLVKKSIDRLRAVRIFSDVKITPIGDAPESRDALVEVQEGQTGRFLIGAGVSTNAGLVGQISLEQNNFDITNPPRSWDEFTSGQSFKGAGQFFRILLEPGTEFQRYRITFEEPYLFDSPYSFGNDFYYFTRARESWDERRIGDVITFGRRFGDIWSASVAFRAEQVEIRNPEDTNQNGISDANYFLGSVGPFNDSAQEILDQKGSHFLTSIKPAIARDTTDSRIFPTTGSRLSFAWEQYGLLGGDLEFSKLVFKYDYFTWVAEDIFERKTVLSFRNEIGLIPFGESVFYERFYAGGIGSLRGFKFRGVSPRSGPLNDPVGGDFSWVSTIELNFPVWENILRGVVFTDFGTVEDDITISGIRASIGAGVRLTIPFFGQLPLALDVAVPISKQDGDKTQFLSFSLGIPF